MMAGRRGARLVRGWMGLALAAGLATGLAACADDEEAPAQEPEAEPEGQPEAQPEAQPEPEPEPSEARFATYNVGLARGFVDFAEERAQPLADALAGMDADVVCLQEVWDDDFITLMTDGTKANFPHSYFEKTFSDERVAGCTDEEIAPLEACAIKNCDGVEPGELAGCVLGACGEEFRATSTECQGCAATQLGKPLEEIIAACRGGGPAFSYGGHNGLVILSRHPLSDTGHAEFVSSLVFRAALHATIEHPEVGKVDIYCTHLAADLSASIEYQGELGSFAAEQAQEIDEMAAFIEDTQSGGLQLVMGDFNNGPAKGSCSAELPENFQKILDLGYVSPYADQAAPTCTFQENNTLVGGEGDGGQILEHIFVKAEASARVGSVSRIFDALTTISTGGGDRELNLSDHFGVQVVILP